MTTTILGVDLGKTVCSIVGLDASGGVVLRRRMRRQTVIRFASGLAPCIVAMEACCGAHHLGHVLVSQGHTVKLMSPEYVRPYVKAQKNDDRHAEAIAEAATRPTMRFVALKRQDQLGLQTLHRARERLVGTQTRLINQMRAILLERGLTFAKGRRKFEIGLDTLLDDADADLSERINGLLSDMREEWTEWDRCIAKLDREFPDRAKSGEAMRRLLTIPGIGNLTATALVAAIDDAAAFSIARDLPAWLGLVPRQHTTGGKPRQFSINRSGNTYLRQLFIHGARAALPTLSKADTLLGQWLRGLLARAHCNVAVVVLAAKLAGVAWATLRRGTTFDRSTPAST